MSPEYFTVDTALYIHPFLLFSSVYNVILSCGTSFLIIPSFFPVLLNHIEISEVLIAVIYG